MSLRDFNAIDDDPISLHNQPLGNESGLGNFHTVQPDDVAPSNTPKIVGALAVVLMVGAASVGIYATSGSSSHPKPIVTASNVPAPQAPALVASDPAQSDPQQSAQAAKAAKAATADPNSLRAALVKTPSAASTEQVSAPMKTASAKPARSHAAASTGAVSARTSAESNQTPLAPVQQPVVTPAPAPSPSEVAAVNSQSSVAVPSDATTASDIPAPAPQEQPAPAQPSPAQ